MTLSAMIFPTLLVLAALLVSLVAGLVFTFATVAMPGLGTLGDREFLRAFQVIDRVIQNNQPLFLAVWVGSVAALVGSGIAGLWQLDGFDRLLLVGAIVLYLAGVQLPTATRNVPLNNQLQTLELRTLDETALARARQDFEDPWNRWNVFRTVCAVLTSLLLIVLVLRL